MQALVFLESFSAVHSTLSYPCAQKSRILLTPIRTIHNAYFQVNVYTSGRQRVDWDVINAYAQMVYSGTQVKGGPGCHVDLYLCTVNHVKLCSNSASIQPRLASCSHMTV